MVDAVRLLLYGGTDMALPRNVRRIRGDMESSVDAAIAQMTWLRPSDYAMVTLALKYAQQMDNALDDHKAVGYLGQQLHAVLRSLGGSPAERKALNIEGEAGGKLAELRAARASRQRGAEGLDSSSS
jgi:transketolase C-terminal domain/subunit